VRERRVVSRFVALPPACARARARGVKVGESLKGVGTQHLPGGAVAQGAGSRTLPADADPAYLRSAAFIMPHTRMYLHTPGTQPPDGLPGWPGRMDLAFVWSPLNRQGRVNQDTSDDDERSQLSGYLQSAKDFIGWDSREADVFSANRDGKIANVSTYESFVRSNIIDQTTISLADGGSRLAASAVSYLAAVVPDRVNFETLTEALLQVCRRRHHLAPTLRLSGFGIVTISII